MSSESTRTTNYHGDEISPRLKDYEPVAQSVPYGTEVESVLFDGYPQIVKAGRVTADLFREGGEGCNGSYAQWCAFGSRYLPS
jgi:hypothetical protein